MHGNIILKLAHETAVYNQRRFNVAVLYILLNPIAISDLLYLWINVYSFNCYRLVNVEKDLPEELKF